MRTAAKRRRRPESARPRAFSIIEMGAALVVVSAAMIALVEFVSLATRQRRISRQRVAAVTEVANQAERLALVRWADAEPEKLKTWQPSAALAAEIAKPACRIEVRDDNTLPACRQIELSVSWPNSVGQTVEPVTLTVWKFRDEVEP